MNSIFSPEGVRGTANRDPLTASGVVKLAMAAIAHMVRDHDGVTVVVGRDTRLSGGMLEQALAAGFMAVGARVKLLGPVPYGAVALETRVSCASLGVMVSGGDEMYSINGLAFVNAEGRPIRAAEQAAIEAGLADGDHEMGISSAELGSIDVHPAPTAAYDAALRALLPPGIGLDGMRVVLDGAHGAACAIAPTLLRSLGAEVVELGCQPNGRNINRGVGVEAPWTLQDAVTAHRADVGVAIGGDGQRALVVDETGELAEPDELFAVIAAFARDHGHLTRPAAVGCDKANIGLERWLQANGLGLIRTSAEPPHLPHTLWTSDCGLAASTSGHYILRDHVPVADGLMAALVALARLAEARCPASTLLHPFEMVPQHEVYVPADPAVLELDATRGVIARVRAALGASGRLLVAPALANSHVRVVIEADDGGRVDALISQLVAGLRSAMGRDRAKPPNPALR
ncbi:phosphoglucosamine mutase [Limimonas halophila]|uniref:Phosphoglucosamine mutase n=1 Tax=Limimonas halophila TaxID=1082479 RepID=A0A1G7NR99_9PROT|nr:phosphoglucosamine mutase [Limimonas halophila]